MGLRVVEPQQDGTPHWHLLVFVAPEHAQAVIDTMQRYALEDTPDEPGANRHRFQVERIDPKRGTATGYIAKYVGKNIDGYGVDADQYGHEATASAERVQAWNSQWGIRQFQFFGTPAIGPYRELRRLRGDCAALPRHAAAADEGDFCRYIELCAAQPLRPFRVWSDEPNRYQEPKGWQVSGVTTDESEILTRFHHWQPRMRPPDSADQTASISGSLSPWSSVNNCTPTKSCAHRGLDPPQQPTTTPPHLHPLDPQLTSSGQAPTVIYGHGLSRHNF